jgi:hypothetical protein
MGGGLSSAQMVCEFIRDRASQKELFDIDHELVKARHVQTQAICRKLDGYYRALADLASIPLPLNINPGGYGRVHVLNYCFFEFCCESGNMSLHGPEDNLIEIKIDGNYGCNIEIGLDHTASECLHDKCNRFKFITDNHDAIAQIVHWGFVIRPMMKEYLSQLMNERL